MSARTSAAMAAAALALVIAGAEAPPSHAAEPEPDPPPTRPNIVLITADDMRLDDLEWMPHTRELLGQLTLTDFISNHPLCCPARAELLTGQYAQHSGVFHNGGPFGGNQALQEPDNTLASWLSDAGYQTGLTGKFINGWNPMFEGSEQPHGWTHFNAWAGQTSAGAIYTPYDYWDWNDGQPVQPQQYTNDAVTATTLRHVAELSGARPMFLWASYVAPHGMIDPTTGRYFEDGPVPAPRHAAMPLPPPPYQSHPSYDQPRAVTRDYRRQWRARIRSLQSVDEGVRDIVAGLRAAGEWDDTVAVFTSDNGFLLGEHDKHGKNLPYEEVLRVPLLARGPGVASGTSDKGSMFVDLAPSIARLAGVTPGRPVDGRSDLFSLDGGWPHTLIQAGSNNTRYHFSWRGTRNQRWTYVHWIGGRKELYDRTRDPYQLRNLAGKRPRVQRRLAALTPTPY